MMTTLCVLVEIISALFALYGVYEFIKKYVDIYVQKKSGAVCRVYIEKCDKDKTEYAIRFAESRFAYGDYSIMFNGITLSDKAYIDTETLEKLKVEFENIDTQ